MQLPHGAVIAVVDGQQFALFRSRKSDGYKEDLAISKAQQFSGYNHGL